MHKRKLRGVKSSIREQYMGVKRGGANDDKLRNGKKEAMMERKYNRPSLIFYTERYTEIERENRILLEKMSNIMQKRPTMSTNNVA